MNNHLKEEGKKKAKPLVSPKIVFIISMTVMILIIIFNIKKENVQELPAVIKTDKTHITSRASGTVKEQFIFANDRVDSGTKLLLLENPELHYRIAELKREEDKFNHLLNSSVSGNVFKLEQMRLKEKTALHEKNLIKMKLELNNITGKLTLYSSLFKLAEKEFKVSEELYSDSSISSREFENASNVFYEISNNFLQLKNDSTVTVQEIELTETGLEILKEQKSFLLENPELYAPDYYLKIENVRSELNRLEREAENLQVISTVWGTVINTFFQLGETISAGQSVAEVSNLRNTKIIAYGNSFSRKNINVGMRVSFVSDIGDEYFGSVFSISPIMKKIKSLASANETANTFTEIVIHFDNLEEAKTHFTPGERLFVKIHLE